MISRPIRFLLWNAGAVSEIQMREIVHKSLDNPECEMAMVSQLDPFFKRYNLRTLAEDIVNRRTLGDYEFNPDAVIRRDEHGVFLAGKKWEIFMATCRNENPRLVRMSYDFGYFSHYNSYMVDVENAEGKSSIAWDWATLSDTVDWPSVPPYILKYCQSFLQKLRTARERPPVDDLPAGSYAVIWCQQDVDLLRPAFRKELSREPTSDFTLWVTKICRSIRKMGLVPVVKTGPNLMAATRLQVPAVVKIASVYVHTTEHASRFPGTRFVSEASPRLIAHAAFHVVNNSSVTNELTLAGAPVVAMGRSWFNDLEIFSEPSSWDTLLDRATEVNHGNRNKWINWWITRQCEQHRVSQKAVELHCRYVHHSRCE
jgi:hypothetical protein